jgi:flagellar hook-length control protein FliK
MPQVNVLPVDMQKIPDIKGNSESTADGFQSGSDSKNSSFSKLVDKHIDHDSNGKTALKRQENSGNNGLSEQQLVRKERHECDHSADEKAASKESGDDSVLANTDVDATKRSDQSLSKPIKSDAAISSAAEESVTSNQFIAMLTSSDKLLKENAKDSIEDSNKSKASLNQDDQTVNESSSRQGSGAKPSIDLIPVLTEAEKIKFANVDPVDKKFAELDQLHQSLGKVGEAGVKGDMLASELAGSKDNGDKANLSALKINETKTGSVKKTEVFASNTSSIESLEQKERNLSDALSAQNKASKKEASNSGSLVSGQSDKSSQTNNEKVLSSASQLSSEYSDSSSVDKASPPKNASSEIDIVKTELNKTTPTIASIIAQALKREKYDHSIQPVIDNPSVVAKNIEQNDNVVAQIKSDQLQNFEPKDKLINLVNQSTQSAVKSSSEQSGFEQNRHGKSAELSEIELNSHSNDEVKIDKSAIDRLIEQNVRISTTNTPNLAVNGSLSQLNVLGDSKLSAEYQANIEAITNQASIQKSAEQKQSIALTQETISIYRKDFANAVKDKVMMMVNQKLQQVEIRLDPPELGNVHVRVNLQNEQAAVSFVVQNQQAKEALEQNTDKLREMLAESGVEVGDTNVSQQDQQSTDEQNSNANDGLLLQREQEMADDIHNVIENRLFKASANGVDYYA